MRYVMTLFWSFVLCQMGAYVLSSMTGGEYNFKTASVMAVVLSLAVAVLSEAVIPNEPVTKHH
ncbi:YjzD family protein [Gottfriedia luciferensis]|uniref:YjzD family protein n=1 Tax=Gottfriedia luciferensis TaxID=178774 RepID=UPI000B432340|nr:YjzD family protein [Gottfriedia luciferensis]